MRLFGSSRRRLLLALLSGLVIVAGGLGIAVASTAHSPGQRGRNEFGMTRAFFRGTALSFTYTKGFYCDTSVHAYATSGCEAGANYRVPPAKDFDPLYITVPLGFTQPMNMLDCPANLVCVDHPARIDLTRLEPALKPLYPSLSNAQLRMALKNFRVPGHDHFVTTANWGKAEWWPVKIIAVTSAKTFDQIRQHKSVGYIQQLLKAKKPNVLGPIPTNLFLYFAVR